MRVSQKDLTKCTDRQRTDRWMDEISPHSSRPQPRNVIEDEKKMIEDEKMIEDVKIDWR